MQMDGSTLLSALVKPNFANGAEVIIDTTGCCQPESMETLATLGRIAVTAAPMDGHVNTPILNLYRRGSSIVGTNSLPYDSTICAAMLTHIANYVAQGQLRMPLNITTHSLEYGVAAYNRLNKGSAEKAVLTTKYIPQ